MGRGAVRSGRTSQMESERCWFVSSGALAVKLIGKWIRCDLHLLQSFGDSRKLWNENEDLLIWMNNELVEES